MDTRVNRRRHTEHFVKGGTGRPRIPRDPGPGVGPEEIDSAEQRLLEETYPDRTEEQARGQERFLGRFATSPAFLRTSRLGSYRFTFPLQELLEAYRTQLCSGSEPVLRVYETVLYKQEVMHSVVVHSHFYNQLFQDYPLLTDSPDAVCAYKDGHFIWRPEAMCGTHSFQLVRKPDQNQLLPVAETFWPQFYVWDNVAIAFHVAHGQKLTFDMNRLRECLNFCERGYPTISRRYTFESFEEAAEHAKDLWPNYESPLHNYSG
ncbi:uncharacterized protein LOC144541765 [Centroberyx gerrardi]